MALRRTLRYDILNKELCFLTGQAIDLLVWRDDMKKQLLGFACILFGILASISSITFDIWVPIISSIPWGFIGILFGVIGLVIVFLNSQD